jgi:hypothetical protein
MADHATDVPSDRGSGMIHDFDAARRLFHAVETDDARSAVRDHDLPHIPGYSIDGLLGEGGGGKVLRALRDDSERSVAIKIFSRRLGSGPEAQRTWRELHLLSQLRLPCLPTMLDFGEHDGQVYVVTELIDGPPLDRYCREQQPSLRDRAELIARVAECVQALHEYGVIHRDLKPGNIIINPHGQPIVVDLGIAAILTHDPMETFTVEGSPIGSPAFMSPEQARGERQRLSTRSDVYSLGATAYYLLIGETPHDTSVTIHEAIRRVAQDPPRDPRSLDPHLPRGLAAIVNKAIASRPEDRYASAAEFAEDLRRWLRGDAVEAGEPSLTQRIGRLVARHPVIVSAAGSVAVALLVLASTSVTVWWMNSRPDRFEYETTGHAWARIRAVNGRVLHDWAFEPGTLRFAELVRDVPALDNRDVVLLGFRKAHGDFGRELYAFSFDHDPRRLWSTGDSVPDIEMPPMITSAKRQDFMFVWAKCEDVFPDLPGVELIAIHRHFRYSPTCLRVYDLAGQVLFEIWHDGNLTSAHWMSESSLLVATGVNSELRWDQRGQPLSTADCHPLIILAARPVYGQRIRRPIQPTFGSMPDAVVWYRCLLPYELHARLFGGDAVTAELTNQGAVMPGRHVRLDLRRTQEQLPSELVSLIVDDQGRIVDRIADDLYKAAHHGFDLGSLRLGDLPAPSVPIDSYQPPEAE